MRISAAAATLLFVPILSGTTLFRVACGSVSGAADSQGNFWQADAFFNSGSFAWSQNPGPQGIPFLNLRYAPQFSYTFQLQASSQYKILLRFLEPNKTAAGQRLFSVSFNGVVQVQSLDIFSSAGGALKNYDLTFPILTPANGQLVISFVASLGNAVISAIEIDDVPPPPPPTGPTLICKSGLFNYTDLTATAGSLQPNDQEFLIWSQMPGTFRIHHALVSEVIEFSGFTTLTVGLGRPGTNSLELTGTTFSLQIGANGGNFWFSRPIIPQLVGAFDLVAHFTSTGQPLSNATTGQLSWEICGFDTAASAATLAALTKCSGAASPNSNCDGLWQAALTIPGTGNLNLIGVQMPIAAGKNWTGVPVR